MTTEIPKSRPIGTVPEDTSILRQLPDGFIVFRYTASAKVGWLDPIFWQGPVTNTWVVAPDGKVPEGTAVFASRGQAKDAMKSITAPQDDMEQAAMF